MNRIIICCVMLWQALSINATFYHELSSLERRIVDDGLALYELTPLLDVSGKVIQKIYVMTGAPFDEESGILTLLNYLHINTKEDIIRRDLFQHEGEVYDEALVRDSELSLRNKGLVRSLAVIVPVQGKEGHGLLVATRDIMSLQPTLSFKGTGGLISNFLIAVGEHNFLGYNKSIAAIYEMQQSAHIWSARYFDPRLFGSQFQLSIKPSLVFARDSYRFEGFLGEMKIERPLLAETDRFGYGVDASYGSRPIIDFNGNKVRTIDIRTTNGVEIFPRRYRWRYGKASLFGRVSIGRTYKNEIFASYNLNVKRPSIPADLGLRPEQEQDFKKNVMPRDEIESYITLGYAFFINKFLTLYDYDNFKLQETKRLGPSLSLSNDFAAHKGLFSDYDFLRPETKLSITHPFGLDSFMSLSVATTNRYDGEFTDNIYKFGVTLVLPKMFRAGRLVMDGRLSTSNLNRDNQKFVLGSDSGVRGVDSRFYTGDKGFRANVELRSSPVELWIFQTGLALFYDVGSAFDQWHEANATHALGFGIRILAPQVSSVPFRIDLAFPVAGRGKDHHIVVPSFGTGQAF